MAVSKPRVKLPKTANVGEVIEIKSLISHDMESGQRKDKDGNLIPMRIINKFTCNVNGTMAFWMDIGPAISANPYISFYLKMEKTSELEFVWNDDDGSVYKDTATVTVA